MAKTGQKLGVLVNCPISKNNRRGLAKHFNLYFAEEVPSRDELLANVGRDIQIIISDGSRHVDTALMDQLPNLGLIYMMSVGLDHLDVEAANTRDIKVTNALGTNAPNCAEHAFALLLSVSRHILAMTCQCGKTKPMRNAQNFIQQQITAGK